MSKFIVITLIFSVLCLFLACLGGGVAVEVPFNLAFGWAFYCYQTLPRVRLDAAGILTAAVCLTAFAAGLHVFLRWLFRHMITKQSTEEVANPRWPIRWTGAIVGLIVLMFVAGLAATGVGHETVWLTTSPLLIKDSMREMAAVSQSSNNFKQMALAMHNYHDDNKRLPPAAITSKDGQPLLSWRVLILPYLEQENLFKEFHLDEPWDSPHNLRLLPRMPKTYSTSSRKDAVHPFATHYQVFVGPGTAFETGRELRLPDDFPDGTSNTILIVEATKAVPWTKPEDLLF